MSPRKASGTLRARKRRRPPATARLLSKVLDDPDALIGAFDTAAALMHQMRSKSRLRPKAVTLQQALKSVAMILVFHLSGFDYRKEQASPRARTARMLAALTVVPADTVIPVRARSES